MDSLKQGTDTLFILLGAIMVLAMHAGFAFLELGTVRATIERMHAERPEDSVIITADKAAENGVLVKVMDQVRAGGIESVSLATLPAGGG